MHNNYLALRFIRQISVTFSVQRKHIANFKQSRIIIQSINYFSHIEKLSDDYISLTDNLVRSYPSNIYNIVTGIFET